MIAALQRAHDAWGEFAGALPARKVIWGLACMFCLWVLLDVFVLQLTGGVSRSTYDAMVRARVVVAAPDPRLVIIDIDEPSLKRMATEFGRWPWPRDTLATVLDYLEQQKPAAIVWDILFSDADRISPGGDAALDDAARRSSHSHFSVARLSDSTDGKSAITSAVLPKLWAESAGGEGKRQTATVAVIPPALPGIAASKLGYNNGYVDADGVLRRFRAFETLADRSSIQSTPMSVLSAVHPQSYAQALHNLPLSGDKAGELIAWRRHPTVYPRVSFVEVFEAADSGRPATSLPDFAGKIIIIGSAAASLHDIHPTPLGAMHPGVDALATVIDNAINERRIHELPRWMHAVLTMALCLGLAYWVQRKKIASLAAATLALPVALLFVSYLTLNGSPVFVDLQLSAALALLFLALLRYWNQLRRAYWCAPPAHLQDLGILVLTRNQSWLEVPLDRLIDAVERHVPGCRIIAPDLQPGVFQTLRWPELGRYAALVGPVQVLQNQHQTIARALKRIAVVDASVHSLQEVRNRGQLAMEARRHWSVLENSEYRGKNT